MSRTVKSIIKEFYEQRDPRDKDYAIIDDAWLASAANTTGSSFTKANAVNILNDARMALFAEFEKIYVPRQLELQLSGVIKSTSITWTQTTGVSTAPVPTDGYLRLVNMYNNSGVELVRKSIELIPAVLRADSKSFTQSSKVIFIFEEGAFYTHYGTFVPTSGSPTPNYTVRYYKLSPWTVVDVEAGTAVETINDHHHTLLLQIMLLMSNQRGAADVEAFIRRYVGAK